MSSERAVTFLSAAATAAAILVGLVENPWIRWPSAAIVAVSVIYILRFFIKTLKASKRTAAAFTFAAPVVITFAAVAGFQVFEKDPATKVPWCSPMKPQQTRVNSSALVRGTPTKSPLKIDKVVVTEELGAGEQGCVKLDVSVRNLSSKAAYVDLAQIRVLQIWQLPQTCSLGGKGGGGVEISKNYDSLILIDNPGVTPVDAVAQSVDPHGIDRFSVTARLTAVPKIGQTQRLIKAELDVFNNGSSTPVRSKPFIFVSNPNLTPKEILTLGENTTYAKMKINAKRAEEAQLSSAEPTDLVSDIFKYNSGVGPKACR
ncbi:hypothetical protein [Streptomyces sp. NPDC001652]|uniref:hypothetical protein n=1 Tax=Streptomyces sp. NPDC001652 TaxID=3154393 RepID=UPI00332ABCA8